MYKYNLSAPHIPGSFVAGQDGTRTGLMTHSSVRFKTSKSAKPQFRESASTEWTEWWMDFPYCCCLSRSLTGCKHIEVKGELLLSIAASMATSYFLLTSTSYTYRFGISHLNNQSGCMFPRVWVKRTCQVQSRPLCWREDVSVLLCFTHNFILLWSRFSLRWGGFVWIRNQSDVN